MKNTTQGIFSVETDAYLNYERSAGSVHSRRCIDGSITGSNCCVGYCKYAAHPGFLTSKLRQAHNCCKKNCLYYIAKPKHVEHNKPRLIPDLSDSIYLTASKATADMEGLKIMSVSKKEDYIVHYVSISKSYPVLELETMLSKTSGQSVRFRRIECGFEKAAALIFSL